MPECAFCAIVAGTGPASRVHEDERCVAFMDIHPLRPGHVLVVPRVHAMHLHQLDEALRAHLFLVATRVLRAQRAAVPGCQGGNLVVNDGPAAGQTVPHVHLHAIPRTPGDRLRTVGRMLGHLAAHLARLPWPSTPRAELDAAAARLRAELARSESS